MFFGALHSFNFYCGTGCAVAQALC